MFPSLLGSQIKKKNKRYNNIYSYDKNHTPNISYSYIIMYLINDVGIVICSTSMKIRI